MANVSSKSSAKATKMSSKLDGSKTKQAHEVSQWVKTVTRFSSQYNTSSWSANCVIGQPRVYPQYGDLHGAWAQAECNSAQFLELEYEEAMYIEEIDIYETLNAGAVVKVSCKNPSGIWDTVWSTSQPQHIQKSRIFSPTLERRDYMSKEVRLDVNCSASRTWCEIDAVQIKGKKIIIEPPPPLTKLASDLSPLVNNAEFSDVSFNVGGKRVHGHKAILSARSEYFRAMFSGGLRECSSIRPSDDILIHDVSYDAFMLYLEYLYTNSVNDQVEGVKMAELLRLGDRFSDDGLCKLANYRLQLGLTVDNVVAVYCDSIKELPVLDDVRFTCIQFMAQNLSVVSKTRAFSQLPQELMLDIVQETTAKLKIK